MSRLSLIGIFTLWTIACHGADDSPSGFYVVLTEASAGSHYFDSRAYPKLGYIADRPDLPISRLESVSLETCRQRSTMVHADGTSEEEDKEGHCLTIRFPPTEAKALENLTTLYLGHQILLLIDGEPVFAPSIRAPISGQSIQVMLSEDSDAEGVKRKLDALVTKPRTA